MLSGDYIELIEAGLSSFTALTHISIHKIDYIFVLLKDVLKELAAKDLNIRMR